MWGPWNKWSECDRPCNGGRRTRSRICIQGNCQGPAEEFQECNTDPCGEHPNL